MFRSHAKMLTKHQERPFTTSPSVMRATLHHRSPQEYTLDRGVAREVTRPTVKECDYGSAPPKSQVFTSGVAVGSARAHVKLKVII